MRSSGGAGAEVVAGAVVCSSVETVVGAVVLSISETVVWVWATSTVLGTLLSEPHEHSRHTAENTSANLTFIRLLFGFFLRLAFGVRTLGAFSISVLQRRQTVSVPNSFTK